MDVKAGKARPVPGRDLHVHVGPNVVERIIDDVALAQRFLEVGTAGFGSKSHDASTAAVELALARERKEATKRTRLQAGHLSYAMDGLRAVVQG